MHPSLGECNFYRFIVTPSSRIHPFPPLAPGLRGGLAIYFTTKFVTFSFYSKRQTRQNNANASLFSTRENEDTALLRRVTRVKKREKRRDKGVKRGTPRTRARRFSIIADFIVLLRIFQQTKGLVKFVRTTCIGSVCSNDVYWFSLPGLSYPAYHHRFYERFSIAINCSTASSLFCQSRQLLNCYM